MASNQRQPAQSRSPAPTPELLSLAEILYGLADTFVFNMTDRVLDGYIRTVGHRTDEDLNRAYLKVLRECRYMPRPAELLEACGMPKSYRDGSKPE